VRSGGGREGEGGREEERKRKRGREEERKRGRGREVTEVTDLITEERSQRS
jgi:hypothetical protein